MKDFECVVILGAHRITATELMAETLLLRESIPTVLIAKVDESEVMTEERIISILKQDEPKPLNLSQYVRQRKPTYIPIRPSK